MVSSRKPWVGGNWKCNGSMSSIAVLFETLNKCEFNSDKVDVAICPTALHMSAAKSSLADRFEICSQNVSRTGNGAFTGEISVEMLKDAGYSWTLVGHSERRQNYGETDSIVADKVEVCMKGGMNVVVCVGELLDERKNGKMSDVLTRQMDAFISRVTDWSRVVIAYEPVWAIGTGVVATPEQAQEAHDILREMLKEKVDEKTAESIRIVYGGSVNEKNCKALAEMQDIDGFLVGGASLKPEFCEIIKAVVVSI